MKKCSLFFISILYAVFSIAQDEQVIRDYIAAYKDIAMEEMKRSGVPAAITLAQGIHETGAGQSPLVLKSNNHFGIKCKTGWSGESVTHTDDKPNECFRKYESPFDSYRDHSDFLKNGRRYAFLFDLDPTDYEGWAYGLKKAGYATNPKYPQIIIKLIEDYQLENYSLIAMGRMMESNEGLVKSDTRSSNQPDALLFASQDTGNGVAAENNAKEEPLVIYPEYEFRINETRVVYVKKGISFLSVAQQYNLSLSRLFEFNDMKESEMTEKDQLIYLQRKRKTGNNDKHVVKQGETVFDISQTEALRLASLLEYNGLGYGAALQPGQVLYLKAKAPEKL